MAAALVVESSSSIAPPRPGSHPHLLTTLSVNVTLHPARDASSNLCSLGLLYTSIPPSLFVDVYQLASLHSSDRVKRTVKGQKGGEVKRPRYWGEEDLEKPVAALEDARGGAVVVPLWRPAHSTLEDGEEDPTSEDELGFEVDLPLHARYLRPIPSRYRADDPTQRLDLVSVRLVPPRAIWFCERDSFERAPLFPQVVASSCRRSPALVTDPAPSAQPRLDPSGPVCSLVVRRLRGPAGPVTAPPGVRPARDPAARRRTVRPRVRRAGHAGRRLGLRRLGAVRERPQAPFAQRGQGQARLNHATTIEAAYRVDRPLGRRRPRIASPSSFPPSPSHTVPSRARVRPRRACHRQNGCQRGPPICQRPVPTSSTPPRSCRPSSARPDSSPAPRWATLHRRRSASSCSTTSATNASSTRPSPSQRTRAGSTTPKRTRPTRAAKQRRGRHRRKERTSLETISVRRWRACWGRKAQRARGASGSIRGTTRSWATRRGPTWSSTRSRRRRSATARPTLSTGTTRHPRAIPS